MEISVYGLLTDLAAKHVNKRKCLLEGVDIKQVIKKLRSNAYEILLKERHTSEYTKELEYNSDAICHLLAWEYRLKNELNQPEIAYKLHRLITKLDKSQKSHVEDSFIIFLLYLRDNKSINNKPLTYDIFNKVTLKNKALSKSHAFGYDVYPQSRFVLPKQNSDTERSLKLYPSTIFDSEPKCTIKLSSSTSKCSLVMIEKAASYKMDFKFDSLLKMKQAIQKESKTCCLDLPDEGYISPSIKELLVPVESIWDVASKLPLDKHRTWESLDNSNQVKELPFASDSGPKTLHYLKRIRDASAFAVLENFYVEENMITISYFIECLKFMLVGMSSNIFLINDNDLFYLKNDVTIEGLTNDMLKSYSNDLMICGSSYRALNKMCSSCTKTNFENHGYIFKELCESIKRYLLFYRVAAISIPSSANLLTVHSHMRPLENQINTFARICKVAYYQGDTMPIGAELLNYLYLEIINSIDSNITLILFSVFYPCCQLYFSRFIQRWLFEGVLIDPYEEFIIKTNAQYSNARARIFWSRAFSLRHNIVPEFLIDLKQHILQCGKIMNLLRLCKPDAALYTQIMPRTVPLISCCLTSEHSLKLNQEINCYYIEMASLCGPRISLYHNLRDHYGFENNVEFASLVEKKRALSFKEMELKRQQEAECKFKLKRKIFEEMKDQMRLVTEEKRKAKEEELKQDLIIAQQSVQMEEMRSELIKNESKVLINYYNNVIEAVDKRAQSFEIRKQKLLDNSLEELTLTPDFKSYSDSKASSSDDLFLSPKSTLSESAKDEISVADVNENVESAQSVDTDEKINTKERTQTLDAINANLISATNIEMYNQRNENCLAAKRNRAKVLNLEFDFNLTEEKKKSSPRLTAKNPNMTEAQRNKYRVLTSEFNILYDDTCGLVETKNLAENENNGNILLKQPAILLTNEDTDVKINSNLASPGHEDVMNLVHRKKELKLSKQSELFTIHEKEKNDIIPMSIDSTPNTEYCVSDLQTPSSAKLSLNTDINLDSASIIDSDILTANSNVTDEGFKFPTNEKNKFSYDIDYKVLFAGKKKSFSLLNNTSQKTQAMRLSKEEVDSIKMGSLRFLLHQSVYIPLEAQMKLANSEILKYFINDENYFSHLHSLRSYFFIMDGEFGRSITEGLFTKLYELKNPKDFLNLRTLQIIIKQALYASSKTQENGERLSFIVKSVPKIFDLSNIDVLDCLTLSYQIDWPLNILLPFDTLEKYDLVFKYLLKLHYVSWILQKIFQELKNTRKECGIDENLLSNSPQYHAIELYRHIMSHFIVILQSYTISEVLQTSWDELEDNLKSISTLDQLYNVHVLYLKTIIFRCLLNKKCAPLMKVIREIFVVILKFYNYLRSRAWNLKQKDIYYTHPNFRKLEDIFNKFQEFTVFVFRVGNKIARVGYQPHLIQMLDMLNANNYYTSIQKLNV